MKKRCLFHVFVMVILGLLLLPISVQAESSETYLTLVHDRAKSPYGHIIVRVAPDRQAPKDWKIRWYVSIYTPKGYKLSLGHIFDAEPLRDRLVFEVPVGEHKIEITKISNDWTEGGTKGFDLPKGVWQYNWPKTIKVDDVVVPVKKGYIKVVNIGYENAQVSEVEREGTKKRTLYTWEQFELSVENGSSADVPQKEPALYPIVKYAEFEKIDQTHLIKALKKDRHSYGATALLNCENPNAQLICRALTDKSLELNMSVARILVKAGDNSAVKPLIGLLEQGSEGERYTAAWTLGELKARQAVEALIAALDDKSILLRNHAAYALAQIKDERALDALIEATKDLDRFYGESMYFVDPEIYIAICFTRADGVLGPKLPSPSIRIRVNAIYALGQIGGEKARNVLLNFIDNTDAGVEVHTIFALSTLSNHKDSKVIDALIKKLKSDHHNSRLIAVQALGRMRAKKASDLLADLAQSDSDEMVREAAQEALEKIEKADL
jgi:HEAT repeat protein